MAFATGPGLATAMQELDAKSEERSSGAARHVQDFCIRLRIGIVDKPSGGPGVTASLQEEAGYAYHRLLTRARSHDLVVMGRTVRPNGLPPDLVEELLLRSGRPLLLASAEVPTDLIGTVMVGWRDTADVARALTAAAPLLQKATRVVFVAVAERGKDIEPAVTNVAEQFAWSGVQTEVKILPRRSRSVAEALSSAADECNADLIVAGAFGHARFRELVFGGCTRDFVRPVLLFH